MAKRDALAVAIDLFLLQGTVTIKELDGLLSSSSQQALLRAGVLSIDPVGFVRTHASLFPVGDHLVFSDQAWHKLPHPGYVKVPADQVMFVGNDSRHLARATIRRSVRRALDLCTGSGIQALFASTHCQRVLAVDINPRAARCTRFNAQISSATNVEVLIGDLFEPLSTTERFDLIVANPPFVPSPIDEFMFRDGGRSGEDVQRRIVASLPSYLAAGGFAQIITELGEREGESITQRVRQWLGGAAMDIYIIRLRTHAAADYAIGHANSDGGYGAYLDSVRSWAENLRKHGYVRVISVLIAFQWSDPSLGPPWDRIDESRPPTRAAGSEIEAVFLRERLTRLGNREANGIRRLAGPIALFESEVLGRGIQSKARATLLGQGFALEHQLEGMEVEILRVLQRPTTLSELVVMASVHNVGEEAVLDALNSLQRRGLVVE